MGVTLAGTALALVVGPTESAWAHTVVPGVRNLADGIAPVVRGVTILVRPSVADELVLTNTTAEPVEVVAPTGEPFLRVSRAETEANTNSVTWYASQSLAYNPITSVPGVDPSRGPTWVRVSDRGTWAWFDPRLRPDQAADLVPPGADQAPGGVRLASWAVPLVIGERSGVLHGHREYRRVAGAYQQQLASAPAPFPDTLVAVVGGSVVPAVYLDDEGTEPVTVMGAGGEPLLRIGPLGTEANAASPSWLLTAAARDEAPSGLVSADAPPRWERVSSDHQFSWLDDRGRAPGLDPPRGSGATGPTVVVSRWALPLEQSGHRTRVRASVAWQPLAAGPAGGARPTTGSATRVVAALGGAVVGALVAAAGVVVWRRRRPVPAS